MDYKKHIEFIKNELAAVSIYEFVSTNYNEEIISKLIKEFNFNSTEELRIFIMKNGPNINGFSINRKEQIEKQLQGLKEKPYLSNLSKEKINEKIEIIESDLEKLPNKELIIENIEKKHQISFLHKMLFKEELELPNESFFDTLEKKKKKYKFSKRIFFTKNFEDIKFNNSNDGDINNWREELLSIFQDKLPQVTPIEFISLIAPAFISIKNGLLYGQAIITDDNTIYLNLSDGIIASITFYEKKLIRTNPSIYYDFIDHKKWRSLYSTGSYDTSIRLPDNIIITTKNSVVNVSFEVSPLLMGSAHFASSNIAPVIERIKQDEFDD